MAVRSIPTSPTAMVMRVEMSATLSDADDTRDGAKKSAAESAELVMDTAELLDSLSADARDICERLKYQSLSAVASWVCPANHSAMRSSSIPASPERRNAAYL